MRNNLVSLLACPALMTFIAMPIVTAKAPAAPNHARKQQALDKRLIKAIRGHNARVVRDLLDKGANANAKDFDADPDRLGTVQPPFNKLKPSALLIVFDDAQISVRKSANDPLPDKRFPDPAEIVKALLDKGADPNVIDYDKTFPLLEAVRFKYIASVRLLLSHHANPNQTWVHGITPLHNAVSNKDIPTIKALLAAGANPEAQSVFDNPAHPLSAEITTLLKSSPEASRDNIQR